MTPARTLDPGVGHHRHRSAGTAEPRPARSTHVELVVAGILLLGVTVAGLYFVVRPGPTPLDGWAMTAIPAVHHSGSLVAFTRLGSPVVVVVGSVTGFLATFRRNRPRALALLVGPALAVMVCDWVVKPVVGRTFAEVVSYPSGTVTAVAALATLGVLAGPKGWRWGAAVLGGAVTVLSTLSVVALRWHSLTDALAGLALGAGVVLLVDGATRSAAAKWSARG